MSTPIPIRLQPSFDQSVRSEREDIILNGLSVFIITSSINDARDVAPLVAERLHPTIHTDGVLSVESAVGRHGEIGFEVVLKVGGRS